LNQLYTVIFLLIILLIVGVLIDNKAFVLFFKRKTKQNTTLSESSKIQ
jgi:hypothetical protein